MNIKKYILPGCVALLGLGASSCVGDLDLQPNDPNLVDPDAPGFNDNSLAICYSGVTCSGISGPGSSYVGGLDAGTSAYLRLIFTLQQFPTDEIVWIWTSDAGVPDITACTWSDNNGLLSGAYYRIIGHITICNQFLRNTADATDAVTQEMRAQARVLRAFSYYNMIDLFGQTSFITEDAPVGQAPVQMSRKEVFDWLESELVDIVDNKLISSTPIYGRVGLDGAEALLARLYLNAEVYAGEARWEDCQKRCENIIARHTGGGFQGSGLAEHYHYLFARDNSSYMPGGDKPAENEILFGFSFDADMVQSYGGPSFVIASTISNTHYIPRQNYGCSGEWSCIRGRQSMAERFYGISDTDVRDDLWLRGNLPAGKTYKTNADGSLALDEKGQPIEDSSWDAEDYSDEFHGFTGAWNSCGGNAVIKFTGRTRNAAEDGGWAMTLASPDKFVEYNGKEYQVSSEVWNCDFPATTFASTDQPVIRLADIYLMYTECYISGRVGDNTKALNYFNLIRARANAPAVGYSDLTIKNLMDERSREFYLESVRRTDLIRNNMFAGPTQTVWQFKGSINDPAGTRINLRNNLYPIPYDVRAAQPDFKQNPGY